MIIGVCGAPNKGKTTFFNALTLAGADIADYPFTTIEPNKGVTYARSECPCKEFNVKCNPRHGRCIDGVRYIPITIIDIAGLVPGAYEGRGLGNKFLTDISQADALIQVIDASGKTDLEGKPVSEPFDPSEEVIFLRNELSYWLKSILDRNWSKIRRKSIKNISEILLGLKIKERDVESVAKELGLRIDNIAWSDEERLEFSKRLLEISKPLIVAANKADIKGVAENIEKLRERFEGQGVKIIPTSAMLELALRKATDSGLIKYSPGAGRFIVLGKPSPKQKKGLEFAQKFLEQNGSTGVQEVIDTVVFDILDMIVVYPVEDESKLSDSKGNILPDAVLLKRGSTALDLAFKIHSDIGESFIGAVDVRTHKRKGKDYVLKDKDILKIQFKH